mgnify:CR=1 FL=1
MGDAFGDAARLLMAGVAPDRLLQGLDDAAKLRLAWLCLRTCGSFPSTWMDTGGQPDGIPDVVHPVKVTAAPDSDPGCKTTHLLLSSCKGAGSGECSTCGAFVCPYGEPLHFHHDGCPACTMRGLPPPSEVFDPEPIQSHEEARDSWALEARLHERVGEFLGFVDPDEAKAQDALDQHRDPEAP